MKSKVIFYSVILWFLLINLSSFFFYNPIYLFLLPWFSKLESLHFHPVVTFVTDGAQLSRKSGEV